MGVDLYVLRYIYIFRQIPVVPLQSSSITNELAEMITMRMTSEGPGQIANDLEKLRVAHWVNLAALYLELEMFWKIEISKGSFNIRSDTLPFPTMQQHCHGGFGGKPAITAKHVRDLFMATTAGLALFADRLENSMSGPAWSDDTTFWSAMRQLKLYRCVKYGEITFVRMGKRGSKIL